MASSNSLPRNNTAGKRTRHLFVVVLLSVPAAGVLCLGLVYGHFLGVVPAFGLFTAINLMVSLAGLSLVLRTVESRDRSVEYEDATRRTRLTSLESQTVSLQQEVVTRARELETATANLRVATKVNALLALCAQHMPSSVMITDSAGQVLWANQAWEKLSGWSQADSARQQVEDLLSRVWNGIRPDQSRAILVSGRASAIEAHVSGGDGRPRWLSIAFQPVHNPSHQVVNFIVIIDDITSHREADLRLQSANDRLQFALRSSGYGIWETHLPTGRLEWDERMFEIYGIGRQKFNGTIDDWLRLIHPDDVGGVHLHRHEILDSLAENLDIDFRIVRPDGVIRFVEAHGFMVRDDEGMPLRMVGLNRDITAERDMQETLHVAEERLELALLATNESVWDWNMQSGQIYRDQRWSVLIGGAPNGGTTEMSDWSSRVHPEDLASAQAALDSHLQNRTPVYMSEHRLRTVSGQWIWTLDRGKVVSRDRDGKPLRMVGTQGDITARKKLEGRLRHSEEIALQVSRLAQIGAWELMAEDRQLRWEPELYRIAEVELGYSPTLEKMTDFFPLEDQAMFKQAIEMAINEGRSFDLECPFVTGLGRRRWVHVFGRADFKEGRAVRLFGAVQDITARREAEDAQRKLEGQLFQVQKLETLGTLAGGIAHDFNNLLTGIIGFQDLALDTLADDHPSRACLTEARSASLRACELVEQILIFGRQSGTSSHQPVDMSYVIEEARRFLRATIPATIQIQVHVAQPCGRVMADPTQLNQVLLNLGTNASHAMRHNGGVLSIALEPVELSPAQATAHGNLSPGAYLRLSINDTGHGMDATTQKRIFDPFFTTKATGEGTGLGLAIVHGIVRAHGGAIEVDSVPGIGTSFHLYFPAAGVEAETAVVAADPLPRGHGEVVCVVDDEQLVGQATRLTLERFGYHPIVFTNAEECLKALKAEPDGCAVLLSDQTMPGLTGMELATEVRKFNPKLPIIIMSGYFSKVSPGALEQIGHISLLAKPFTAADLTGAVNRALHPDDADQASPGRAVLQAP